MDDLLNSILKWENDICSLCFLDLCPIQSILYKARKGIPCIGHRISNVACVIHKIHILNRFKRTSGDLGRLNTMSFLLLSVL